MIQQGFDNLLSPWEGDVELIVFVHPGALTPGAPISRRTLAARPAIETFELLRRRTARWRRPAPVRRRPVDAGPAHGAEHPDAVQGGADRPTTSNTFRQLARQPGRPTGRVEDRVADEQLDVISRLKGFVGLYTVILSVALLFAAILLIWNTIRTAMFARRREIEVMKLVGATDWFIRIPFMLEGLIQGLLGGLVACAGCGLINNRWTAGVEDFPATADSPRSSSTRLPVPRMLLLLGIGVVAGAIGSGIAASRFLDVADLARRTPLNLRASVRPTRRPPTTLDHVATIATSTGARCTERLREGRRCAQSCGSA